MRYSRISGSERLNMELWNLKNDDLQGSIFFLGPLEQFPAVCLFFIYFFLDVWSMDLFGALNRW